MNVTWSCHEREHEREQDYEDKHEREHENVMNVSMDVNRGVNMDVDMCQQRENVCVHLLLRVLEHEINFYVRECVNKL